MYPGMKWMNTYVSSLDKPMFICEYAHAMGNAIGNLKNTGKALKEVRLLLVELFGTG